MDSKDLSARVLKTAGHNMILNNYYDDAIMFYKESKNIKDDAETIYYLGIAYYKTGKIKGSKIYIRKAMQMFQTLKQSKILEDEANYYLMLIYSDLRNTKELKETLELLKGLDLFENQAYVAGNQTFIVAKEKRKFEYDQSIDKEIVDDPVLIEIYNFIYPYVKELYNLSDEDTKKIVSRRIINTNKEVLKYFGKMQIVPLSIGIIIGIIRDKKTALRFLEITKRTGMIRREFIESLPVFTRYVVKEFLKKMGLTFEKEHLAMPYVAEKKIEILKSAIDTLKTFEQKKDKEKIKKALISLSVYDEYNDLKPILDDINKAMPISGFMLKKSFSSFIINQLRDLKRALAAFYSEDQAGLILKVIVSDLDLEEKDKIDILFLLGI
ncbi:MAG: hypothetical protein QXS91_02525 [Candidatus Anstonellales archaeon]